MQNGAAARDFDRKESCRETSTLNRYTALLHDLLDSCKFLQYTWCRSSTWRACTHSPKLEESSPDASTSRHRRISDKSQACHLYRSPIDDISFVKRYQNRKISSEEVGARYWFFESWKAAISFVPLTWIERSNCQVSPLFCPYGAGSRLIETQIRRNVRIFDSTRPLFSLPFLHINCNRRFIRGNIKFTTSLGRHWDRVLRILFSRSLLAVRH